MAFSIHIGNAVIGISELDLPTPYFYVEQTSHPDAPQWPKPARHDQFWCGPGDVSGITNGRYPSYISFNMWARDTGLYGLFRGKHGLLIPQPGCQPLYTEHLVAITNARRQWERENAGTVPGWGYGNDAILARLIWYEWWFRWALLDCPLPAIQVV